MCRVFAEKSSITGNKVGKICVKRPILRPRSMSSYNIYEDILREADNLADLRYCFIEADVSVLDGTGRRW